MDIRNFPALSQDEDFKGFIKNNLDYIPKGYVGQTVTPEKDYTDYPQEDFAAIVDGERYFPIFNPGETVASILAFLYQVDHDVITSRAAIEKIAYWLKAATEKYDLPKHEVLYSIENPPKPPLNNKLSSKDLMEEESGEDLPTLGVNKLAEALEEPQYALKKGDKYYIKLGSASDIVKAAAMFEKEYRRLAYKDRAEAAERIKTAAIKKNIDISDHPNLTRYATRQVNEFTKIALDSRINACHDPQTRQSLKLIRQASLKAQTPEEAQKLAEALDEIDKTASWRYHIDAFIPDAYKTFGMVKQANSDLPGEAIINSYDLKRIVQYFRPQLEQALAKHFKDPSQIIDMLYKSPRSVWGRYPTIREPIKKIFNENKAALRV